jgi:DNA-binding IclR family transcriptional regulator
MRDDLRGLGRYKRILQLFTEQRSQWTIAEAAAALEVPASTLYRTVQDMVAANFLDVASDARYRLGASFIELDRLSRITDPLYTLGGPVLDQIVTQAKIPCVAMLARLYNDTVMCVSQANSGNGDQIHTSYERGRPRPLTRGATSKVILAQLPAGRLKRLLVDSGLDEEELAQLRAELPIIRRQGFCITRGEVDPGLIGIAAPAVVAELSLIGSLNLVCRQEDVTPQQERRLAMLVHSEAKLLSEELAAT